MIGQDSSLRGYMVWTTVTISTTVFYRYSASRQIMAIAGERRLIKPYSWTHWLIELATIAQPMHKILSRRQSGR